ncbi:MAG TPA: hypothetical protein VHF22_15880, partial [Planctomycetota bacterium]|nr:hypothetical protein [Planctomycetota bacterium]
MTYKPPDAIAVRAPMKLVLAGEYSVLEPGSRGIVAAVDRHVICTARAAADGVTIEAPGLAPGALRAGPPGPQGELRFDAAEGEDARKLVFARLATELAYRHVVALGFAPRTLALRCEDTGAAVELPGGGRKKLG